MQTGFYHLTEEKSRAVIAGSFTKDLKLLVSKMRKVEKVDLLNPFWGLKFYECF